MKTISVYKDLAWTEPILAPPDENIDHTDLLCKLIKEHSQIKTKTLLHFGCGAGIMDYIFKRHFDVTGVDISKNMLKVAQKINPEVTYIKGDMRKIKLNNVFDAVTIPDSIGYMTTEGDLKKVFQTICRHLKPGGLLLIVAHISEEFKENNFVYTGSKGDIEITLFENNYIPDSALNTYEATMVYLIRQKRQLEIYTDCHTIGLFGLKTWLSLFKESKLQVIQMQDEHFYIPYIMGEGEYPLKIFICTRL